MRKRKFLLAAGACLATLCLAVGSAQADPNGPPQFRALAVVGAETTQGLFNALSDIIKDGSGTKIIASYDNAPPGNITTKDPATNPACTIVRPNQGGAGTTALVNSLAAGDGCVDAARVVTDDHATRPPGLTYVPLATDTLTYATRGDSTVSRKLTLAQLTAIYNCQVPSIQPLIGVFGAGNRTFFLQRLGITDAADLVSQPGHTCIKDTDSTGAPFLANDGRLITAPNQLVTYSSAPYLAQVNNVIPDKHGTAVLASIDGKSPQLPNTALPSAVVYATRGDSSVPRNLSLSQLAAIYNCTNTSFQPLIPPAGNPVRNTFLTMIGVPVPGPCVTEVPSTSTNDGRTLTSQPQLMPYTISTYLDQINNVVPDIHGAAVLGSIGASSVTNPPTSPTVLNPASTMSRLVYDVIPTAKEAVEPWKSVFVGSTSAVCSNTATIVRQGFSLDSRCGQTTIRS
ncbi:MAG TPA: hypothetical protein VFO16_14515 [Pseudonocardiaceae bacterium]|nr:hypothetical protein [Pseudonocardiaceae bacterium]